MPSEIEAGESGPARELVKKELGPLELRPGQANGFPDHPHRGFETVTYLLDGQMEHRDSSGNHGVVRHARAGKIPGVPLPHGEGRHDHRARRL